MPNITITTPNRTYIGFSSLGGQRPPTWRKYDLDLINNDLLMTFNTPLGSRVMLPNFGSILPDLLFEQIDSSLKNTIRSDVERVISLEPRVQLLDMQLHDTNNGQGVRVDVTLLYLPFNIKNTIALNFVTMLGNTNSGQLV